jgi:integrase
MKTHPHPVKTGGGIATDRKTLGDVLLALDGREVLTELRCRDLRSSVKRIAQLLGDNPDRIPLDLIAISAKLATVNPIAVGMSAKTFSDIRSNFMAAVNASKLRPVLGIANTPLSRSWKTLMAKLSTRRQHIGLSRLARYASANGIDPARVDDAVIEGFISAVRKGSLHRKPNGLHRRVTLIWNEAAVRFNLPRVNVPSFRQPVKRTDWNLFTGTFRKDADDCLEWCAGLDVFAADARARPLAPQTLRLRRDQMHAAVTALVDSGIPPKDIRSLADLVSLENFKRILRRRHQMVAGSENMFNADLARMLVEIGRDWVKLDTARLKELTRLAGKVPKPMPGLTAKNRRVLRQFDDPVLLLRLYEFPNRIWAEVKRDPKPDFRTLVKAQAALAVAILSYMPIRLKNLTALAFDVHLFLREGPRATSSLELPPSEVKNRKGIAFDVPPRVARMLIEYRNHVAPKVIGYRPDRLFVNADGSAKTQWTVAWTIRIYLRRAGIVLSPHQFRHVSAKLTLDAYPGQFQTLAQLLGDTEPAVVNAYAGIDSRRAGRHHQRLVEEALAAAARTPARLAANRASPRKSRPGHLRGGA